VSDTLYSPSWYRVADLKPRLRLHTEIQRHEYRGRVWFIAQDQLGARSHRFTPEAYRFIGLMDGQRTVNQLWHMVNEQQGDDAPTQEDVIRLLGQLHSADLLICDTTPDSAELFRRFQRHERMKWKQRIGSPLAVRFPVFDPDRFLDRTYPYVGWLFGWAGAVLWLVVVGTGAVLAAVNWGPLTENVIDRALAPANLLLLWLVYPFVKALHELGHGYAIKKNGGEVHDIGIMLLVLVPVPYVDAAAASGFRDKHQRMLVGAAGIMVELFLGAIALFVWLTVEAGAIHAIAYNVMLISGVSTLLFNGNPLLRFDGYYVCSDFLEIPNLGTRANKYLGYLIQRYLFNGKEVESPADSDGERFWFVVYGIAAFCYRMFIMFVIILYISGKFFTIGVLLAMWAAFTMIVLPVVKSTNSVLTNPKMRQVRGQVVGMSLLVVLLVIGALFAVPAPFWTRTEGVTWPAEQAQVRAQTEGFVVRLLADNGSWVEKGQPLIETRDPFIEARLKLLEANKKELESQLRLAQATDRVQVAVAREGLAAAEGALAVARERLEEMLIRSPATGRFVVPQPQDLPERFLKKGQLVAYVVDPEQPVNLRVVIPQDEIALVRKRTRAIDVMPAEWGGKSFHAELVRLIPGGTTQLPSAALGIAGGGSVAVDPRDTSGRETLQRIFEMEVRMPEAFVSEYLGRRMHVRIDHGLNPIGLQLYRTLRQLFLRQFGV
jgi:putative peptide zinc metalloprotease protein